MPADFKVAVLLCTYNGQAYLQRQLQAIAEQDYPYIDLYVSDDGSTDATLDILKAAQVCWTKGCFQVFAGPRKGFAENFMSLVLNPAVQAHYYAYSDQDDYWFADKISHAVQSIQDHKVAALYCSRTKLVDEQERLLGFSPLFKKQPSFRSALVQCIAGGNTMLFNDAARSVLLQAGVSDVPSHDWWTYLMISGCGGFVQYDPVSRIAYRQHSDNVLGSNQGFVALQRRLVLALQGNFRHWSERNSILLAGARHLLTSDAQEALMHFQNMRSSSLFRRIYSLFKAGVYRQSWRGNVSLFLAVILRKA